MKAILAARDLLGQLGNPKLPICMEDVCHELGIYLRFADLDSINGYFMFEYDTSLIVVNDSMSTVRQRFSVAHELGHLTMYHAPAGFVGGFLLQGQHEKWQEVHANRFASEFLMPKMRLSKLNCELTPAIISQICQVSKEAARIRLEQLGWTKKGA